MFEPMTPFTTLSAVSLLAVAIGALPSPGIDSAKMLFCATGSIYSRQINPPADEATEFAVAVVEINSAKEVHNVSVDDFIVFNSAGHATGATRIVAVERFIKPGHATGAYFAFYLNNDAVDHRSPWNGTLPAGDLKLRIRVALARHPGANLPGRCRLRLGPYRPSGPVDGVWGN